MRPRIYKERTGRSRSGPNIPESQRHTVRVRLSSLAYALAAKRALDVGTTVAKAIEDLLIGASTQNGS